MDPTLPGLTPLPPATLGGAGQSAAEGHDPLRRAAEGLEASFLAEMLKLAGIGKTPDAFGGGPGEDAFASFLIQAYADKIVEAGGIGLADRVYRDLALATGQGGEV